jgi:hypothetical protein
MDLNICWEALLTAWIPRRAEMLETAEITL